MSALSWWRSWHGAPTDHKWQVISVRSGVKVGIVSAVAWALLDYASQHKERGTVEGFDTEMYAVYSGFDETEVVAVIKAMTEKGVIVDGKLSAWEKRQPKREDDSTPRVNKHREKKHNETQCNAPEKEEDTEDRLTDKDTDGESDESTPDLFLQTQLMIESVIGISPVGEAGIKAVTEIAGMGATLEDIQAGYQWLKENRGDGKPIQYCSSLVGPIKTAILKRMQSGHTNFRKRPGMLPDGV